MFEHGRAIVRQVLIEADRVRGLAQQLRELPLPVQQPRVAQVFALMLDQIEREQHRIMVEAAAVQRLEIRKAIISAHHHLAIDQERLRLDAAGGLHDSRKPGGPSHPRAFAADHQPEAVVLDFMNPQWSGRRLDRLRGSAGFDELGLLGWGTQQHESEHSGCINTLDKRPGARRCRTTHTRPLHQTAGLPVGSAERKNIRTETEYEARRRGKPLWPRSARIWCWRRWNKRSAFSQSITDRATAGARNPAAAARNGSAG